MTRAFRLGVAALGLVACAPNRPTTSPAPSTAVSELRPKPTINSISVTHNATQLLIVVGFHASGTVTQYADTASFSGGTVGHLLPGTKTVDTLAFPLPTTAVSGTFSVRAGNTSGWSPAATAPWSYTPPVVVTVPAAPTSITLAARMNGTQLYLVSTWAAASGATSYKTAFSLNVSPWTALGGHTVTVLTDSVAIATPTAITPYFVCVSSINSAGTSSGACNSVSYTPPAPPPGTPVVDSLKIFPASATFDPAAPVGTTYTLIGVVETSKSGLSSAGATSFAQVQFCVFAHWTDGTWGRVTNDTSATRCNNLWSTVPLPNKVATLIDSATVHLALVH